MTRNELHSVQGFHPPSLIAAAAHLRTLIPRARGVDATALINHEGKMSGFLDAIAALEAAATKQPENTIKKDFQPYAQPQTENPNKK